MEQLRNKEENFVSVVLYLNKADTNIYDFLHMIYRIMENNFKKFEIICVNDDAGEFVAEQLKMFKQETAIKALSVINMGYSQGLEASMNAGIDLSIGDYVFEFDSCYIDYDPELIMQVYDKCQLGYDIVMAKPPVKSTSMMSRFFYHMFNKFSNMQNELSTERFCIISRRAVNRVQAYSKTIPYRKAVYAASGLNVAQIEYCVNQQTSGKKTKDNARINTATDAIVLFTDIAYRISLFLSILMAIVMLGFGVYTIIVYIGKTKPVAGFSPIMGVMCLGFLSLFILMTFLFKYLQVLVHMVFKRQKYMIASVEKL